MSPPSEDNGVSERGEWDPGVRIRASEVGQYAFCPMAWYLQRVGGVVPESPRIEEGIKYHAEVGRTVAEKERVRRQSNAMIWLGILLALLAIVVMLLI